MLKNCAVFVSISRRAMSKKFKSDYSKCKSQKPAESSKEADRIPDFLQNEVENEILTGKEKYKFERFPLVPIKSVNDKKEYSVIKLENGLIALLVSDERSCFEVITDLDNEESDIIEEAAGSDSELSGDEGSVEGSEEGGKKEEKLAACSLTVGVGSFCDPIEVPGMAHFIEHMLFMGSKKYPEENYFDSYIKKLGGSDNASTECESTNFYFECPDENLSKAMDVFSNLFTNPLLSESAMVREREAVESEFIQNMHNDQYRRQQILMACAVPGNPAGKFVWGNLKTLKDNITDSFLHEAVHKFWKTRYSSHKMTLAVQARLSLDTLERIVAKHFSNVPRNDEELPKTELLQSPFDMSKFNKMYYIESVKDNISLELSWVMPPVKHLFKTKPTNYLSWTIGHEGKGSLISYLRKKHWAVNLSAGHDDDDQASNEIYSIFVISIILTELGAKNIESVLHAVFSYISMLKETGPVERAFKEIKQIADLNFRFEEESPAVENVEILSDNMQLYPIPHYINGYESIFDYAPDEIIQFLKHLSPSSVNIMLSRKHHETGIELDLVEPWFTTKYSMKDIPKNWMSEWLDIKPYSDFHTPEPNTFIASDFTLYNESHEGPMYPEKILSSNNLTIWYKPDTKFTLPTGFIGFQFVNKDTFENLTSNILLSIYSDLLNHLLIEELYPSVMALLEYKIIESDGCLMIEVYGFNENLHGVLEKIADGIRQFNCNLTEKVVEMYKETRLKAYYNNNFKIANLARELRLHITLEKSFTSVHKYNTVRDINIDSLRKFSEEFFNKTEIQCLIQGNIKKEDALIISKNFVNKLQFSNQKLEKPFYRVYKLLNTDQLYKIKSFDMKDSNCITVNYYQFGTGNVNDYCTIDLLLMLLEEPLFDQLRTQEQLGYDVSCSIREIYGVIGFTVSVVSQLDKQSVEHVEERISVFLEFLLEKLRSIPLPVFNRVVKSLIALKQCSDLHLKEEVGRNWAEIKYFEYAFDRLEQEQKVLAKLTPGDVVAVLERFVKPSNPNFRKLTVQVEGYFDEHNSIINSITDEDIAPKPSESLPPLMKHTLASINEKSSKHIIRDITEFQSQLTFYPENKIFH